MYLKSELLPALLSYMASNTHEEYPQKLFEQAPIMKRSSKSELQIVEEEHVAVALASQDSNYTQIRSLLDSFCDLVVTGGSNLTFEPLRQSRGVFMKGRSAEILFGAGKRADTKNHMGTVGEVSPDVLEGLGLKMPVSAFEINLEPLVENLLNPI
jgi:phenylalanyl-tRNA synthetase beta chain